MYDDYYRFKQRPFSIAPDPSFLYLSERHREALAHLMYGLRNDGGFVLITGEVGTGKTTLVRSLIDEVPEDLDIAFVLNPRLTVNELLETLCEELGIPAQSGVTVTNKHLIDRINKHLLRTHALGRSTVVIIDEAQNLSPPVLEQIRLLTNLETNERKLVRIILLGQPELAEMLDRREMRQLVQRVTARYHLGALGSDDTRAYIAHRLTLAGGNPHLFTRGAARETFRLSRGIPRLINVVADRGLLGAYVEGKPRVTARIVRKAAREAFGKQGWLQPRLWMGVTAVLALAFGAAWALWDRVPAPRPSEVETANRQLPASAPVDRAPTAAAVAPAESRAIPNMAVATSNGAVAAVPPSIAGTGHTGTVDRLARPAGLTAFDLQRDAYVAVFERWNAAFDPGTVPCNQAPDAGLQCLRLNGTWRDIERLDHPVVVELWDDRVDPYYAAIIGYHDNALTMKLGGETVTTTVAELGTHWYGNYIVLWQMPPDYRGTLKVGDAGPSVAWLRQHLANVLQIDLRAVEPARFDDALQAALVRFQRDNDMVPDGVAGPLTWIAMSAALPDDTPRLRSEP